MGEWGIEGGPAGSPHSSIPPFSHSPIPLSPLQPRVHRLAFQREDAEDALVDAPEGFPADEALQGFDAEGELAQRERTLGAEAALAEAFQVLGGVVLRA